MKQRTKIIIGVAGLLCLLFLWTGASLLGLLRPTPVVLHTSVPSQADVALPTDANFRQGINECGPYAAAAFVRALTQRNTDPADMVRQLPWKLPRGYTHPQALESLLRAQGLQITGWNATSLQDDEKKAFLQEHIAAGRPVILLVYMYGYQHYITVVGYDDRTDVLHVYDPAFTKGEVGRTADDNGSASGNRRMKWPDLLSAWSQGGIAGFYRWYAVTGVVQ